MTRNARIDLARGLLMLYVIAVVHGVYWLNIATGSARSILLFEMPSIFFVSGAAFFLSQRRGNPIASPVDYVRYLAGRGARILLPYWCFAITCLGLLYLEVDPVAFGPLGPKLPVAIAWLDPFQYGRGHTVLSLNSHLWFIPVFLAVTACMPLLAMCLRKLPSAPWVLLPLALFAVVGADIYLGDFARNVVTYGMWSAIGYAAASDRDFLSPGRAARLCAASVALLLSAWVMGIATLDMQANKFPPNFTFFLFGMACLSGLLAACAFVSDKSAERLAASRLLRPFISKGYSLYLWQGLAYTAAAYLGARLGLPVFLVWLLAVVSAVALGSLAGPVESVRLFRPLRQAPARPFFESAGETEGKAALAGANPVRLDHP